MSRDYPPAIGDLVVVHDPGLAERLGKLGALGVVVRTRRGGARALFLPRGDAYWFEAFRLYPHPAPEQVGPAALLALAQALRVLQPEEAELADRNPPEGPQGSLRVEALCRSVTAEAIATLQQRLGDRLEAWEVRPYGMALVTVLLQLRARDG
jgi:hypothetical protein